MCKDGEADYWWLRSPGYDSDFAAIVDRIGGVYYYGDRVDYNGDAVRPAFNLNLSSVLFTSAAKGGKTVSAGAVSKNADLSTLTDNDGYKLTLKDSSRNFTISDTAAKTVKTGDTLSLEYTGAATGTNEYISAMITNASGEVIYYGQLEQPTAKSGTADFVVPSDIEVGTYTLKVFNEQINGDYKTDYSSDFVNIPLTVTNLILHTNGGTINSGNLAYYTEGEATTLLTDVTKDGYIFEGWYASEDFSGDKVTEIAATETGNKVYWAKWTAIMYNVFVNGIQVSSENASDILDTADGDGATVSYNAETNTLTLTDATINNTNGVGIEAKDSGITIVGVDTDADGTNTVGGSTSAIKADGEITIKGKIGDITGGSIGGVYSTNGNINIDKDAVLGNITSEWYTLQTDDGNIVIDDTVGNINGQIAITSEYNHDVVINGKVGNITSEQFDIDSAQYGIFAYKDCKIAETAEVGDISGNGSGIMAVANIEINGKVGDVSGQHAIRSLTGKVTINSVIGTVKGECDDESASIAAIVGNTGIELADNIVIKTPINAEIKGGTNHIVYDTKGTEETEDDTYADIVELAYLYNVTFETDDGSDVEGQTVVDGNVVTKPNTPTRSGYKFDGWYTDADYTTEYDFSTPVSEDITIYAKWTKKSSGVGGGGTTRYTVKFETNGGTTISNKTVTRNSELAEPTAPTKDDYTFDGWYTDKELTKAYDFDTKVTKAITLYAKWTENEVDNTDDKTDDKTDIPDTPVWENPFTDVKTDDWYYENARYAVENGLFNGTTETTFAPNGIITRAMMVTVLYRAEGEPTVTGTATFEDVDLGAYYAKAVVWGQQNGIIKGYSETEFAPDQNITREQIAAIMHRYAQYKGYDVSVGENTNILSYSDYDSISEYAIASMQYAVGSGLMKGKTTSTLNPLDNATRAEIAAILNRFIEANK